MLHDPKWNHGTLAGLITWLEGKPRDETYVFSDTCDCLIRRYMGGGSREAWPREMLDIYHGNDKHMIARGYQWRSPQTYGDALNRAYKAREAVAA